MLGDALKILGVQRTPQGRRRIINRAQLPFVIVLTVVVTLALLIGVPDRSVTPIVVAWLLATVPTVISYFVPWERFPEPTGILLGVIDLIATAITSSALIGLYPTIGAIQLIPVLILAFSFGLAGTLVAILGSIFVSILPAIVVDTVPSTAYEAMRLFIVPGVIAIIALATQAASRLLQGVQRRVEIIATASENEQTVTMTVLNSLDVGTAYIREDGTIGFKNRAFEALVAQSAIDPETQAGTLVYEPDRVTPVSPHEQMMAQAARGEYFDSHMYVIGEGANQSSVLVTSRPVVRADGRKIGSAFVSKDITELADSLRVREEFLSVVSHELRTPLTSIMGYMELIEDDIDAEALGVQEYLDTVSRNSKKLMSRIEDLLHVADPHLSVVPAPVSVPELVASCVDDVRMRAHEAEIELHVKTQPAFTAEVDERRIRQVLDNLLTNAIKYSRQGGTVTVEVVVRDGDFTISVGDDGVGIADHELRHVFERFYRTVSARDAVIQGTGLGLSIVQDIVRAHGGEVSAQSMVGVGSIFSVRLPLVQA
jgi:signal transduction histidine kinase